MGVFWSKVDSMSEVRLAHISVTTQACVRAVDYALTLSRVWPIKNVGTILGHASAAAYAQRSG